MIIPYQSSATSMQVISSEDKTRDCQTGQRCGSREMNATRAAIYEAMISTQFAFELYSETGS